MTAKPKVARCPCHSGLAYAACCAPYHRAEREAPDPVALMRSRYAAFALRETAYLVRTLHTEHADRAIPEAELKRVLHAEQRRYPSLVILDHRGDGNAAEVLFRAGVFDRGRDVSFFELSDFGKEGDGWRYRSGVLIPVVEMPKAAVSGGGAALDIDAFLTIAGNTT